MSPRRDRLELKLCDPNGRSLLEARQEPGCGILSCACRPPKEEILSQETPDLKAGLAAARSQRPASREALGSPAARSIFPLQTDGGGRRLPEAAHRQGLPRAPCPGALASWMVAPRGSPETSQCSCAPGGSQPSYRGAGGPGPARRKGCRQRGRSRRGIPRSCRGAPRPPLPIPAALTRSRACRSASASRCRCSARSSASSATCCRLWIFFLTASMELALAMAGADGGEATPPSPL